MPSQRNRLPGFMVLGALLAPHPTLSAQSIQNRLPDSVAASLAFTRTRYDLETGSTRHPTTGQFVDFSIREFAGDSTQLELTLGKVFITQTGRALTAGKTLTGSRIGLGVRHSIWQGDWWQLNLALDYHYQIVDHRDPDQTIEMTMHTTAATLEMVTKIGTRSNLHAGAMVQGLFGEEVARGTVDQTSDLNRDSTSSGFLEIEYLTGSGGSVGVLVSTESGGNGSIYFERRY